MSDRWRCPNCDATFERGPNLKVGRNRSVPNWQRVLTKAEAEDRYALAEGTYRNGKRARSS